MDGSVVTCDLRIQILYGHALSNVPIDEIAFEARRELPLHSTLRNTIETLRKEHAATISLQNIIEHYGNSNAREDSTINFAYSLSQVAPHPSIAKLKELAKELSLAAIEDTTASTLSVTCTPQTTFLLHASLLRCINALFVAPILRNHPLTVIERNLYRDGIPELLPSYVHSV